jgi:hypothetical protein
MKPTEDFLAKAEKLVAEREGRIICLINWIEILESRGYGTLAARPRQLLAIIQQNLAISRDNVRLMRKARGLEREPHLFPGFSAAEGPHAISSYPDAAGRHPLSRFIVGHIIPEEVGVGRRNWRHSLPSGDDAKSAAD